MALIGFLFLFVIGAYLAIAGAWSGIVVWGLSGRMTSAIPLWLVALLGGAILYYAFANVPFTLDFQWKG
jgi:hypothetical protein